MHVYVIVKVEVDEPLTIGMLKGLVTQAIEDYDDPFLKKPPFQVPEISVSKVYQ